MDKAKLDNVFRDIEALSFRAESLTEQAKQIKKELRNMELTLADALRAELEH